MTEPLSRRMDNIDPMTEPLSRSMGLAALRLVVLSVGFRSLRELGKFYLLHQLFRDITKLIHNSLKPEINHWHHLQYSQLFTPLQCDTNLIYKI